ncbi:MULTISPECIES: hypothetical protein [Corallococcus]|uniref:hypothetical protein n=1 Tax=Corallococcus TaxID=83461 RepID=UPI00117D489C|nr:MULTISPECIES: hypothetical protein [Corallococcus]NBD07618.1 hypothetical protein [Corallococcus silvisoli]TSC33620.1 hypothetical protein FOF48_00770 [Corallococcus sp. Z5C101001]
MNWRLAWRAALVATAVALAACGSDSEKNGDGDETPVGEDRPGMGRDETAPQGTAFTLPTGLELEQPIKGYNDPDPTDCDDKYEDEAKGQGELVRLCLIFRNTTNRPITVQLPPGLVFVSRNRGVQNGMLAQRVTIEVPAGERYFQPLFLYCVNSERQPSSPEENYDMGPVTQYADFQELFRLLENKTVTSTNFPVVQQAMTDLSDNLGLSASIRARINAL